MASRATVASRAMAVTEAMATTTIPLATMVDMVVIMTTVSPQLPDALMIILVSLARSLIHTLFSPDQGGASYGKTPRRGAHQGGYKPY